MLVREVMTGEPITARASMSAKRALQLLDQHSITMMPVVRADRVIVGVVSEADLIKEVVSADVRPRLLTSDVSPATPAAHVEEVMNRHPLTVLGDTDVAEATELMTSTSVKSLPVLDSGRRVVGVISRRDVVHVLARSDQHLQREVAALFQSLEVDWLVDVRDGVAHVSGPSDDRERQLACTAAGTIAGVVSVDVH